METISRGKDIIEIVGNVKIKGVQDFTDIIFGMRGQTFLFYKEQFTEDFFVLSSGIAGEMLQKASTYRKKIGIVGDYSKIKSKPLKDFIYESNKNGQIVFVDSIEKAIELLQ